MQELLRRSAALFSRYPWLGLPVALADLLAFTCNQLEPRLTHLVIKHLSMSHSVLGSAFPATPTSLTMKAVLLTRPIVWGNHLLGLCFYSAAMISTSLLVSQLLATGTASADRVVLGVIQSGHRLVLFAFKILVCIGIAAFPLLGITLLVSGGVFHMPFYGAILVPTYYVLYTVAELLSALIAWLFAPLAVGLLRPPGAEPIAKEAARLARFAAALTVLMSGAIALFATSIGSSILSANSPMNQVLTLRAAQSLLSATPYILLFIALSLLAAPDDVHNPSPPRPAG